MPSPFSPLLWGLSSFSMHLDTTVRDCWGVEAEAGWECKEAWSGRSGQSNRVSRTIICGLLSLHDCFLFLILKLTNATGGRDLCVVCKARVTMQDVQGHLAAYGRLYWWQCSRGFKGTGKCLCELPPPWKWCADIVGRSHVCFRRHYTQG